MKIPSCVLVSYHFIVYLVVLCIEYVYDMIYLRNTFHFFECSWIMNTSGLLHLVSEAQRGLHINFARDPKYS